MKEITIFLRTYVPYTYRQLGFSVKGAFRAIFGRQDPDANIRWLVFDHGFLWRWLRELFIWVVTAGRLTFGLLAIVTTLLLILPGAIGGAILIPFIGLWQGFWLTRRIRKAKRALGQ